MSDHPPVAGPIPPLQGGDVLLFSRKSVYNTIIQVKTWSRYTHVEIADDTQPAEGAISHVSHVFASRNGVGCGYYEFDSEGLALILRPPAGLFNLEAAITWFYHNNIRDQGYDWLGLINFTYARLTGRRNGKMFCSEFATRFYRAGGADLFPGVDADTIAPSAFRLLRGFTPVWMSDTEIVKAWESKLGYRVYKGPTGG